MNSPAPDAKAVYVDPLRRARSRKKARQDALIGIVSLLGFVTMKVLENITLGPIRVLKKSQKESKAAAMELLTRFGWEAKALDYPDRLSGGQAQRVAIVRALAMEPEIMLFDEITSALDPMLVGEVLDSVRELRDAGLTIVMATHEMSFAKEFTNVGVSVR